MTEEHEEWVRATVRAVPAGPVPEPWRELPFLHAGGLLEIGVHALPSGEELVLVVTTGGRGVMSATGEKIARDRTDPDDDWYDEYALTAEGIGPLAGIRVRLAGLHGGGTPALHPRRLVPHQLPGLADKSPRPRATGPGRVLGGAHGRLRARVRARAIHWSCAPSGSPRADGCS